MIAFNIYAPYLNIVNNYVNIVNNKLLSTLTQKTCFCLAGCYHAVSNDRLLGFSNLRNKFSF